MPVLTQGNSATVTFNDTDSITIQAGSGTATFECPVGNVVAVFSGTRTFGPYNTRQGRVTATVQSVYFETADGTGKRLAAFIPCGGRAPDLNAPAVGGTFHTMVELAGAFVGVQIPLLNFDTANARSVTSVSVAVGDGSSIENSSATYYAANTSPIVVPPARVVNGFVLPGMAMSDYVPIVSVPRASGSGALLFIREYCASGTNTNVSVWQTGGATGNGWATASSRTIASRLKTGGDFTTTNSAAFDVTTERAFTSCFGVLYNPARPTYNIFAAGDSITDGALVQNKQWLYMTTQALRNAGVLIEYANFGVSGAPAELFLEAVKSFALTVKPDLLLAPCWTPNSGPTNIPAMEAMFIGIRDFCKQNNIKFAPWNGTPRSTGANTTPFYTAPEDVARKAWLKKANLLADDMIDTAGVVSVGTDPDAYKAGKTDDGTHPNTSGYTDMDVLAFRRIIPIKLLA